jgi:glucose/arabinose dehydrogenase
VGNRVPRLEWVEKKSKEEIIALASKTTVPALCFGAHWAGNGWCFLTRDSALGKKGDALIAFHGSWNSSDKVGYRIERVAFDAETTRPYGSLMLVGTLKADGKAFHARPVDCVEAADGSVLFSCDETKRVYRIAAAK